MSGERVGTITHFYNKICVAVLELKGKIEVGDTLHFLGHSTDFKQKVTSLQIEHKEILEANPGEDVAIKLIKRVRKKDKVYKILEED